MTTPDRILAEEALVARLLAPLARLEPVLWPGPPPPREALLERVRRPRRARPAGLRRLLLVALLLGTGALASAGYAIEQWVTRDADPSPTNPGGPLACLPILGQPGPQVAALLAGKQIAVSWRFTRYADPASGLPSTSAPLLPPLLSVAEGVAPGPGSGLIVFLRAPGDPYAPPLPPPEAGCSILPARVGG